MSSLVCYWDATSCAVDCQPSEMKGMMQKIVDAFYSAHPDFPQPVDGYIVKAFANFRSGLNESKYEEAEVILVRLRGRKEHPMKSLLNELVIDASKTRVEAKAAIVICGQPGDAPLTEQLTRMSCVGYRSLLVMPGGNYTDSEKLKNLGISVKKWEDFAP